MKANELEEKDVRIGNWVQVIQPKNGMITTIKPSSFSVNIGKTYKAIPLNEEWLVNFGFITDKLEWWNGVITIGIFINGFFYCPNGVTKYRIGKEIKYVHQLQNLYFAITGDELTLKETK